MTVRWVDGPSNNRLLNNANVYQVTSFKDTDRFSLGSSIAPTVNQQSSALTSTSENNEVKTGRNFVLLEKTHRIYVT